MILHLSWLEVAPAGNTRPAGFNPQDPADPRYDWNAFDRLVMHAAARGLEPVVNIKDAPAWAEGGQSGRPGTNRPDPVELGRFAEAAARRYGGSFTGLPRVRSWEVWNEPNASFFLYPQKEGRRLASPEHYRLMVNEFAQGIHRVHNDNLVVAGALFPFVIDRPGGQSIGPLRFMRALLCLSSRLRPLRRCGAPVQLDIWSHHPYTSGGPTHRAGHPDSVSIRELPRMRRLLSAAVRHKRVVPSRPVPFWVTEFGWDTRPPDPRGVPLGLHGRWVSEALYRMWRARVSRVAWFQLRDDATAGRPHNQTAQSGLYRRCARGLSCDRPKPALRAFTFPFVAFRSGRSISVWGRTPGGRPGNVVVEQGSGRRWRRIASLPSGPDGVFSRRLRGRGGGRVRARLLDSGAGTLPFSLKRPPDRRVNPFG